jgi:ferredoxin-nitrite reductase
LERFLALVEEKLGAPLMRAPNEAVVPRPPQERLAHIGVHPQKQEGLHWIGVLLSVGKLTSGQMRGLARISHDMGDGDIRLTVWQNLLLSGIPTERIGEAVEAIEALGLSAKASSVRAGLVACTGSKGCKFAASDTKGHAEDIAAWCDPRVQFDGPVNIHLTGCHHSCAQHYIGDIGLLAARVPTSEEGDTVEGYHIHVGGGFGEHAALAREIYRDVKAEDAPRTIERMLKSYLAHRQSQEETFFAFARRHETDALKGLFDAEVVE